MFPCVFLSNHEAELLKTQIVSCNTV